MKSSFSLVAMAAVLALAVSGCRYDKAAGGAGAGDGDVSGIENIGGEVDQSSDTVSLDNASERRFEDYCEKCTDVDFAPVYFLFDSSVVSEGEIGKVEAVASHLRENPKRVVVISGHCDERGSNEYNLTLGEKRALILDNYLVGAEITADRIQTRSFGEMQPAMDGHDESAWSKNRRGEFAIYLRK